MENIFQKWKNSLEKTRKFAFGRIANLFGATDINENTWDELESTLIQADLGIETTLSIIKSLKDKVVKEGITRSDHLQNLLMEELISRLEPNPGDMLGKIKPDIILLVGVNGSGKTTTAAKLARLYSSQGKKVLLGAADTFRAAAIDQLKIWAERLGIPVIAGQPNADSAAVAYDAVQSAISKNYDMVIIDTAGRLHTRYNLMEELKKVVRVVGKALPGAPSAVWLVLDATTGQNALQQAKSFKDAVNINAVILAKLDSSARGGMAFAIQEQLKLPILYAGLGEKPEDLQLFDRNAFVKGILTNN